MIRPLNRRATRHQRALGRIALTVTLAVTAGIGTAAGTAVAEIPGAAADPVVISPGARFVPRATIVLNAGETGFLTAQEGDDRLRWIDYATGTTTVLDHRLPEPLAYDVDNFRFTKYPADFGHGSDTVALYTESPAPHVTLQQRAGGGPSATVPIPEGQSYVATYGDTVITRTGAANAVTSLHLLRLENGEVRDRELEGLPVGWNLTISEGDARSVAVRGIKWEDSTMSQGWWVVDLATGSLKALSTQGESVSFDRDTVFHLGAPSSYAAQVYRRDDLDAEPTTLDLRDVAYDDIVRRFGDGFVTVSPPNPGNNEYRGNQLVLRDATGSRHSLLAVASPSVHRTPDGSLLVAGAEESTAYGALDWGYYLFTPAGDGVTRKRLADIEDREAKPAGISLGSGILTTADDSQYYSPGTYIGGYRSTWLKTAGRPEELNSTVDGLVSGRDANCSPSEGIYCVTMFASGDGHHGRKAATEQDVTMLYRNGAASWGPRVTSGLGSPELVDLSGRFGVVNQAWGGQQAVLHFKDADTGSVLLKREPVAASVWGNTLWSADGGWDDPSSDVPTTVAAKNLSTGAAGETFDAGCVPRELQAVGRWVYWQCDDSWPNYKGGGVYDRQAKRSLRLGTDSTLLGDGYLVRRSDTAGLTLVDLHNGLPAGGTEADLPQRVVASAAELGDRTGRRSGWTVDRFGGHVAYTGEDRRVRIVPSGVPASRIAVIDADTPAMNIKAGVWKPRWWLSKPAASWSLTLRNKATGKTVRTLSGGEARGLVAPSWDGKDAAGKYVPNGAYTWALTAKPADGVQADLSVLGTVPVTGGAAVWRDMVGDDGFGDLLAMDTTGAVSLYRGTGTGALSSRIAGSGSKFATDSVLVPVGDVDGDRCADVFVRVGDQLRAHRPGCGKIVTASSPYTLIGAGWAQYDQLTSPGDVNGDGFVDLIARKASTGDVYFYAGTADHRLKARVRIGTNWKLYKRIVGAGDLNGDGRGDLLGLDSAGVLWRYYGTSTGGVTTRVRVGGGWGGYSALVGTGDLSGDGRADLLARDTAGKLWRYASTGAGTYGGRVLIGTGGWNGFKGLF
ncbi:VCBS repeat-containing protein [Streptomyces sp. PKU-EA00015]|uniref:FG-GAP-like repeat-containing protein n=1 Tax=Streptomyces sp. PKU-EA00015 TaxID=2748326 RepID=UPI0015A30520|nr:FG-GAP-like repeat-containing protein [Streptomyces sp. PKU-EA00015]NWF27871.1 VCBS repeat-containing protein [Streptomyces sp. PKU-EA00015]